MLHEGNFDRLGSPTKTEVKKVCDSEPKGEVAQSLMGEMFTLFSEVVGQDSSFLTI
ncbi:hypothetical protein [Neobacillus drentensis]|uniref:hypothetical protein n=1 Tax=Neobacillus drentensis TaxID=220684 RepID=UPI002FFF7DB9